MDADGSDHAVDPAIYAASSSPSESLGSAMDESTDSSEDSVPADHEEPMECETPTPEPSLHEALSSAFRMILMQGMQGMQGMY
jgi:hypothetical protein